MSPSFFTASFPQFIHVESVTLSRIFTMKRVRKLANQITGSIFIGSALALALSKN